jgi:hypothetical protein
MAFLSLVMTVITVLDYSSSVSMMFSTLSGIIILVSFAYLTPPTIAKAQAFFFLHNVAAFSIDSGIWLLK